MKETLRIWWLGRTLREQRLLLAMSGVAALVLAWLLVIRPLDDALSAAKERHGAAVIALAEARSQAAAIRTAGQAAPANLGAPLDSVLSQTASEAGFPVTRVEREGGNQATIVIDSARPQAFFAWVQAMEGRGALVERLVTTANSDQTISVQATFRARGG